VATDPDAYDPWPHEPDDGRCEFCGSTDATCNPLDGCRFDREMAQELELQHEAEVNRAVQEICNLPWRRSSWIAVRDDIVSMRSVLDWDGWRCLVWNRLIVVRAVLCLMLGLRICKPDHGHGYEITADGWELWHDDAYWFWVETGEGWWDWWAFVQRDCPDTGY